MKGVVWPVIVTMAIQALVSMAVFAPPVFAPAAHDDIGFPASWIGIVTALTFAAAIFGALFSGGVIARVGALRMSQFSLLLCGSGIAPIASSNAWLVALGALVMGLGYGPVTPSSSAILAERTPERIRSFIFSLKQTGVPIGGALTGAIVPALIVAFRWNGVYLSEVARIAPPGRAGAATGASLAMTYTGVVVLPMLFWVIVTLSDSYAAAFVAVGSLTLWWGVLFLKSTA